MWDVRRRLVSEELPAREAVVCFCFREAHSGRRWWWLVVNGDEVDLCLTDPGREVDLTVRASLEAMIRVWVGRLAVEDVLASGEVALDGSAELARSFPRWIGVPSRVDELEDALSRVRLAASGGRGDPRSG